MTGKYKTATTAFKAESTNVATKPIPMKRQRSISPTREQMEKDPRRFKTKICKHFAKTGNCKFGSKCMFAHGEHELRRQDEQTCIPVRKQQHYSPQQRKKQHPSPHMSPLRLGANSPQQRAEVPAMSSRHFVAHTESQPIRMYRDTVSLSPVPAWDDGKGTMSLDAISRSSNSWRQQQGDRRRVSKTNPSTTTCWRRGGGGGGRGRGGSKAKTATRTPKLKRQSSFADIVRKEVKSASKETRVALEAPELNRESSIGYHNLLPAQLLRGVSQEMVNGVDRVQKQFHSLFSANAMQSIWGWSP